MGYLLQQQHGRYTVFLALSLLLQLVTAHPYVRPRQQSSDTAQTTIPGSACPSPSCTVTLDPITSLVITPSPVIITPSGAQGAVTVTFDPVTLSSIDPGTTVLANPDATATLTLGSATLATMLTATGTASYVVSPSETPVVAVEVIVQPKAQIYVTASEESGASCAIRPPAKRDILEERLIKVDACTTDDRKRIDSWISDARKIVKRVLGHLRANPTGGAATRYFAGFEHIAIRMAQVLDSALDASSDVYDVVFRCEASEGGRRYDLCVPGRNDETIWGVTTAGDGCSTVVYLCQPLLLGGTALDHIDICSINLNTNWEQLIPFGAKTVIHEMTHSDAIGKAVDGLGRGTGQHVFRTEVYHRPNAIALTSEAQINNADTWAWYFVEQYTELECQGVTGWVQPT